MCIYMNIADRSFFPTKLNYTTFTALQLAWFIEQYLVIIFHIYTYKYTSFFVMAT